MGVIKKIQYNCRHATYLIEKRQHTRLSGKERLHLLIHLSGCSVCRLFQRQSRMINQLVRSLFQPTSQPPGQTLDEEVKRDMQRRIDEQLNK